MNCFVQTYAKNVPRVCALLKFFTVINGWFSPFYFISFLWCVCVCSLQAIRCLWFIFESGKQRLVSQRYPVARIVFRLLPTNKSRAVCVTCDFLHSLSPIYILFSAAFLVQIGYNRYPPFRYRCMSIRHFCVQRIFLCRPNRQIASATEHCVHCSPAQPNAEMVWKNALQNVL